MHGEPEGEVLPHPIVDFGAVNTFVPGWAELNKPVSGQGREGSSMALPGHQRCLRAGRAAQHRAASAPPPRLQVLGGGLPEMQPPVVRRNSSGDRADLRSPVFSDCVLPFLWAPAWAQVYSEFFLSRRATGLAGGCIAAA